MVITVILDSLLYYVKRNVTDNVHDACSQRSIGFFLSPLLRRHGRRRLLLYLLS